MNYNIFWPPRQFYKIAPLVLIGLLSKAHAQDLPTSAKNSTTEGIAAPSNSTNLQPPLAEEQSNVESNNLAISSQNDLISLEYRNAPFIEVIRTLADAANLNITLSPEVDSKPVSIRLSKVTYEQALKAILEIHKFGAVFDNGILKIDTLSNLTATREAILREKESSWKSKPSKRLVWQVNYAKADALAGLLLNMLKPYAVDPRFSVTADMRTNKLIIEGIDDVLSEAKGILQNLDKRKQQVLIEARIVEASSDLAKTLNITWGTRFGLEANRGLSTGILFPNSLSGNVGGAGALGTSAPSPGLSKKPAQLGTMQFTIGSINSMINIDAILRAYETESLANVIASPRIVVQDQESASIQEDVSLQRATVDASGSPSSKSTAANLSLNVKPQVTSDNTLELDIQVQRQTPTNAASDPVQGSIRRTAKTKLIVANGETAVIGGLYQTQKFKGQARIPFLGRLPLIGFLFRTNEEQSFRSELMVLITPRILPNPGGGSSMKADLPPATDMLSNYSTQNAKDNAFTGNNNSFNTSEFNNSTTPAKNSGNAGTNVSANNFQTNPNNSGSAGNTSGSNNFNAPQNGNGNFEGAGNAAQNGNANFGNSTNTPQNGNASFGNNANSSQNGNANFGNNSGDSGNENAGFNEFNN